MFNINNLINLPISELQAYVEALASHLEKGKDLAHVDISVNKFALQALDQKMANPPSEIVLDDLHTLLLTSLEKGLDKTLSGQLGTIRRIRQKFLASPSTVLPDMDFISQLPIDVQKNILFRLSPPELRPVKLVQKLWNPLGAEIQISTINDAKIPLDKILKNMDAHKAISWLKANPACKSLRYADFKYDVTGMVGFDNACIQEFRTLNGQLCEGVLDTHNSVALANSGSVVMGSRGFNRPRCALDS
jgi:hypothetical protein